MPLLYRTLAPLALIAALAGCEPPPADPPAAEPTVPAEPAIPAKAAPWRSIDRFEGQVVAADAESITLRGFGAMILSAGGMEETSPTGLTRDVTGRRLEVMFLDRVVPCARVQKSRTQLVLTHRNGVVEVLDRAAEPARRFPAGDILAAGGWNPEAGRGHTYRLADVRPGDEVYINCREVGKVPFCQSISILRRPGGLVPPAPGERIPPRPEERSRALPGPVEQLPPHLRPVRKVRKLTPFQEGTYAPYHERMQAEQDFEELGVPLPEKFDIEAERHRIATDRQGEQLQRYLNGLPPLAPPPREATPKP